MMTISNSEKVLRQNLAKERNKRYSVIEFCEAAEVTRTTFYLHYKNMQDLCVSVLTLQIQKKLRNTKNETIDRVFYTILNCLQENKIFYNNIVKVVNDPKVFFVPLKKELAIGLENYMRPRGAFSVRRINLVAQSIYAIIFNWVLNEFQYDIRDVYQSIKLLLPLMEIPNNSLI